MPCTFKGHYSRNCTVLSRNQRKIINVTVQTRVRKSREILLFVISFYLERREWLFIAGITKPTGNLRDCSEKERRLLRNRERSDYFKNK